MRYSCCLPVYITLAGRRNDASSCSLRARRSASAKSSSVNSLGLFSSLSPVQLEITSRREEVMSTSVRRKSKDRGLDVSEATGSLEVEGVPPLTGISLRTYVRWHGNGQPDRGASGEH